MSKPMARTLLTLVLTAVLAGPAWAQHRVTTPEEFFGHQIGADYVLPNYTQFHEYMIKLANESDRMVLDTIGLTSEGRPQVMGIISSPENIRNLDHYKDIARRLAKAEGVSEAEAQRLAQEGKAIIWIDGGLHATEVLGAQQLTELVYRMNDYTDPETLRILDDVILLAVHANPDGMELVSNWYMREPDPMQRSTNGVPVLYNKYAGHDNNRDFYMSALNETTNILRVQSREWYPQIVYNHHQTGPAGAIMFAPPFRDPPNHYLDPLIIMGIDQVGSAMHQRFVLEGKGGTTMRSGASYSTWWNGGLRTTPYFKNQIGLLTETIGNPTPQDVPFIPRQQLPRGDIPLPVEPTEVWHFRQSIEYSETANWAVLDYASRNSDHLLYNIWRMGMNSIERGGKDYWTVMPEETEAAAQVVQRGSHDDYIRLMKDPANRDPRGFIVPSDQKDFLTATKFINTLLKNGVDVHRATAAFRVNGKQYPAGSYVVKTAQAYRPHVLDMFEKQNHPNDFAYPGGPPIPPYDVTGWTLAWQMGIQFDRIQDGFDGPFQLITTELASPPAGTVAGAANASGYLVDHINDAFIAVNRVLKKGGKAAWYTDAVSAGGKDFEPGAIYLQTDRATIEALAKEKGLNFVGVTSAPSGASMPLNAVKIGLWDRYGGSMPSGWTRKILEDFEFDFDLLFPQDLDTKDLSAYDAIIFEDGAIPPLNPTAGGRGGFGGSPDPSSIPAEFRGRLGNVTAETTIPKILDYARKGGAVVAIGSSANLAYHAGLPVEDQFEVDGRTLTRQDIFIPGTILEMKVEHTSPLSQGLPDRVNVMFDESPVFRLQPNAQQMGVKPIAWFDSPHPLKSGWAWGQEYLDQGVAALEADLGQGKLFIFGPPITFRAQPQGVFPFLFNGIFYGSSKQRPIS